MTEYNLLPHEVVLLKDDAVYHGKGSSTCELILTNLNLVVVKKGVFRGSKGSQAFPLSQIKVYNGRAQAQMDRAGNSDVLAVFFVHSEEKFRFVTGGKQKIQTWIGKVNEAVTGEPATDVNSSPLSGTDRVVGVLKDTLGAFKSFRAPQPEPVAPARAVVATKCVSCGAPVSGVQGQRITCSYCNAAQQL
jgi:hypothetical protein